MDIKSILINTIVDDCIIPKINKCKQILNDNGIIHLYGIDNYNFGLTLMLHPAFLQYEDVYDKLISKNINVKLLVRESRINAKYDFALLLDDNYLVTLPIDYQFTEVETDKFDNSAIVLKIEDVMKKILNDYLLRFVYITDLRISDNEKGFKCYHTGCIYTFTQFI